MRSRPRHLGRRPVGLALFVPWLAACAMDLPISERIANVRPLAMRVEAVDPFASPDGPVRAEVLPVEMLRVVPFMVDEIEPLSPERIEAELEPVWLACPLQPVQGIFACLSAQLPLALDDVEACPPVDLSALDPSSGELPVMPAPCRIATDGGVSTPAAPSMQVPIDFNFFLGGDLELTMIAHRPDEGDTERCAEALLGEEPLPSACLVAVQRASIGPDAEILRLAADAGLPGLDQLGPVPPEDQIPEPDANTRITTFRVVVTDEVVRRADLERVLEEGPTLDVARGDTLEVTAGQTIVVQTTASEDDLQTFLIPGEDGTFEERQEYYVGDWYRTWGTLLGNDSDDPTSYNTWRMVPGEQDDIESELPPDGRATLYYVLRDDRQGVDWFWFHVMVTPAAGG
jgi:hypothetical protein